MTVIAQSVRVASHRGAVREALAGVLDVGLDRASVKATTTDRLGRVGLLPTPVQSVKKTGGGELEMSQHRPML